MSKRKRESSFSASSINERSRADPSIAASRRTSDSNEPIPSIEQSARATTSPPSNMESPFSQVPRPEAVHADASTPRTPFPGPRARPQGDQNNEPAFQSSRPQDSGVVIDNTGTPEAEDVDTDADVEVDSEEEDNQDTVGGEKVTHQSANDQAIETAVRTVRNGKNVFVTGPAGSGKTYFIHKLVELLGKKVDDDKEERSNQDQDKERVDDNVQAERDQAKKDAGKDNKRVKYTGPMRVEVIAPTGTAALNVGGRTCHGFFGLTPNTTKQPLRKFLQVAEKPTLQERLQEIDVLVIDEISMVSNEFLQQMDFLMRAARRKTRIQDRRTAQSNVQTQDHDNTQDRAQNTDQDNISDIEHDQSKGIGKAKGKKHKKKGSKKRKDKPFGGVILVAVGDFAQLAPVLGLSHCIQCGEERTATRRGNVLSCLAHGQVLDEYKWAFNSPTWTQLKFKNILLEHVMRQHNDDFKEIVYSMWLGNKLTPQQLVLLKEERPLPQVTTHLFTRRDNAAKHNQINFQKLTGPAAHYVALDRFNQHPAHDHPWLANLGRMQQSSGFLVALNDHRYSSRLELKEGMPVILLHNIHVEGGLVNGSQGKIIGYTDGDPLDYMHLSVTGNSDPLGYSWHDTEGKVTNDYVPSLGGTYAAYKREEVERFIMDPANRGQRWPVVRFNNGITRPIVAECCVQEIKHQDRASLLSRTQVPLMAGWALTIHKAQGMTMDAVVVNVDGSFDPGQEYVAISRARTLQGLEIHGLQANGLKYRTAEVVRRFMKTTFPALKHRMQD